MSAAKKDLGLAAALSSRSDQEGVRPDPRRAPQGAERSEPVKLSVRLEVPVYRRLLRWQADQTGKTGQKVDTTKVGAALFAELLADDALADRVMTRIRAQMRR